MDRPIVLIAAAFAAGLAIGGAVSWLIRDEGVPPAALPGQAAAEVSPQVRASPPPSVPAQGGESRPAPAPIVARTFREATGGIEGYARGPTAGTGRISGMVRTEKGQPLAGVVVRAVLQGDDDGPPDAWRTGDGPPPDRDVQERVQEFIEGIERARATRREATTTEGGEFAIDGLLDDRYSIQAYLQGYALTADQSDLQWGARPGDRIDFTATPVIVLPVDVRLADGSQPRRAQITVRTQNTANGELWKPARPEIRLGAGAYTLSAVAGDRDEWRSETQDVVLKEGVAPTPMAFKLAARTGIRGRVKLPKGSAMDSLSIFALRCSGTAAPTESALMGGQNAFASSWNGFQFEFQDLAPGKWAIGAGTWESLFATTVVDVAEGAVADVVIEVVGTEAQGLAVRVFGPGGVPVTDVALHLSTPADGSESKDFFTVRPMKDGAWVIAPRKQGGDAREWVLGIHSDRYGDKSVPLPATLSGELRVDMVEPATLDVTVTGYAGSGLEGRLRLDVRPVATGKDAGSKFFYGGTDPIGPGGRQTFKPLQPGRYRVHLQYQRERWQTTPLDRVDVDVTAGANAVSIPAPVVHTLVVVFPGAQAGSFAGASRLGQSDEWHNSAKVGTDGLATFEGLVAGSYRVSLYGQKTARTQTMTVTVPASGPVPFTEQVETAIVIKALDGEGYLASVGLQAGDVVTGADGVAFDGARPALQVLSGLLIARKDLRLSIVRDGKPLEATVDSERFGIATNRLRALDGR